MPAQEVVKLDFACIHDREEDEKGARLAEYDAKLIAMRERLGLAPYAQFVTAALFILEHEYEAQVTYGVDMWFGVSADVPDYSLPREEREGSPKLHVYLQCDRFEDGLVAILEWFLDNRTSAYDEEEVTDGSGEAVRPVQEG